MNAWVIGDELCEAWDFPVADPLQWATRSGMIHPERLTFDPEVPEQRP
jgi:hypothetical protein